MELQRVPSRGAPGTGFGDGTSTLKQYFVLLKSGSKYYLKYKFLAFPILEILGLSTPLVPSTPNWPPLHRTPLTLIHYIHFS